MLKTKYSAEYIQSFNVEMQVVWDAIKKADYKSALKEADKLRQKHKNAKGFPKGKLYAMYNEYYFQSGKHKEQYELGESNYRQTRNKHYLYSSGVGAAWYAKQLFERGNALRGKVWAKRSVEAWKIYHELISNYYNSYVHLVLAYGLLGETHLMEENLNISAKLCGQDSKTFKEFGEIREIILSLRIGKMILEINQLAKM